MRRPQVESFAARTRGMFWKRGVANKVSWVLSVLILRLALLGKCAFQGTGKPSVIGGGARPSAGAATLVQRGTLASSQARPWSRPAAPRTGPEDGRAPSRVTDRLRAQASRVAEVQSAR